MFKTIKRDIEAVLNRDPAAGSVMEVLLCYPGLHAVIIHRIAHWFYNKGLRLMARAISSFNRIATGIDIHPAAKIGSGFFIDHGAGVVIGETTEIGENVTMYQGATLGGTGKDTGKRHPTVGNNVVICCGAKVLGPFKVGENAKIGAGAVVLKEVPPNSTVVGVPGRSVKINNINVAQGIDLDQVGLPDPIQEQLEDMLRRIEFLEQRYNQRETAI